MADYDVSHERVSAKAQFHARLIRYKHLLLDKWWIPLIGLMLGSAIGGALAWYAPPKYISMGRMIMSIKLAIQPASLYSEELSNFLGTQAALMQSAAVVNRAHTRVLAQKPDVGAHQVALRVSVLPKTTIFVLQAIGSDAEYTQAFLQACMDEYIALKKEMRMQTSDTTVAGLTEQVMRLEKDLRKAEEELVQFQGTNSVFLSQEQGNSAGNYVSALYQRLASQKSEYQLLQLLTLDQSLARQQASGGATIEPLPADAGASTQADANSGAAANPAVQPGRTAGERPDGDYLKAQQQLLLMKAEQQELGRYLKTNHPKMVAMKDEIARREELLKIFRNQSDAELKNRKDLLALEIQILEKELKAWEGRILEMQQKTAEYQRLKGNVQRIQALYDQLLATMQTLDVNKEISPESVETIEKAIPAFSDPLEMLKKVAAGAFVGLAMGIGLLLLLDRLDDRMSSFTELQELFDEDVLGQVPREGSGKKQTCLIEPDDTRHSFVESYRNLRSSLLYMAEEGERPKAMLVTSSVPNDGKSVTAANLAITLASAGSRVLLVDADMRKGRLHRLFDVPSEPGLSEVLAKGVAWETTLYATKFPHLSILPSGAFTVKSSELFIADATKKFLQAATAQYDYVIIDTAPVMAADDVTTLAPQVDGVLFVIRAGYTSARVARASLEALYQRQARVLGLVFNAIRHGSVDYYYYRYKDYYTPRPPAAGGNRAEDRKVLT